jgi:hypothetical protein
LESFFEPIELTPTGDIFSKKAVVQSGSFHEIHGDCSDQWLQYEKYLSYRLYVKRIIDKYVKIKPFIIDQAEEFYNAHMKGNLCIGLQVRYSRHVQNRASLQEYE